MQIQLSDIVPEVNERALYIEKIYYHKEKPETIFRLAGSGLHSRFALINQMQKQINTTAGNVLQQTWT